VKITIEGSQTEILAVMERLGDIDAITTRVIDGDAASPNGSMNGERSICGRISERERQILGFLMEGVSDKEICRRLEISVSTVKQHIKNLLSKIGVANRTRAALWAQRHMPSLENGDQS